MHKRIYKRNDDKDLLLFNTYPHTEINTKEMEVSTSPSPNPHLRWNPSRQEWITYSQGRSSRTAFPPKEYCPLCPGGNLNFPTEIPFKNFEVAVFPNRWPSFNTHQEIIKMQDIKIKNSNGHCEVVVYSSNHHDTIADMPLKRIELLTKAWIDRYQKIFYIFVFKTSKYIYYVSKYI